jgi:hypothetical protein
MQEQTKIQKLYETLIDQVFEIEKKVEQLKEPHSISRNINRLKEIFENINSYISNTESGGYTYHNPIGEYFSDTRTDCEASIAGQHTESLVITEVIKPIIHFRKGGINMIVRKGVVIAESKVPKQ